MGDGAVGGTSRRFPATGRHAAAAGLGVAFLVLLWGYTVLSNRLNAIRAEEFVVWPVRVQFVLVLLVGAALAGVTLAGRWSPWLPTVPALLLAYGVLESEFVSPVGRYLPTLGRWQPQVGSGQVPVWDGTVTILCAGVTAVAAVWGWVAFRRSRRSRHDETAASAPR